MASLFAEGTIQWLAADPATTVYTISIPFQAKGIEFEWQGLGSAVNATSSTAHSRRGKGFTDGTNQRCVATQDQDAAATMVCTTSAWSDCIAATVTSTPARDGALALDSINATDFKLIVNDATPVDISITYKAYGGDDVTDVFVGDLAEPATAGTQTYLDSLFSPDVLMFASVQATVMDSAARNDSGLSIGYSTSSAANENIVVCGNSDDASPSTDSDGIGQSGFCIEMIPIGGGASPNARALRGSHDPGGFKLTWTERGVTDRISIYMAIKGGNWRAGGLTIDNTTLNNTATVTLPFDPIGLSLIARGDSAAETADDTADVGDRIALGVASSVSSRRSMTQISVDTSPSAVIISSINFDKIQVSRDGAANGTIDLDAISAGFRLKVTTAYTSSNAAAWMGYLAFGSINPFFINLDAQYV